MKKISQKQVVVGALILIGAGFVFLTIGIILGGKPYYSLSYNRSQNNFNVITGQDEAELVRQDKVEIDSFERIDINVDYTNIIFEEADKFYIEYQYYKYNGRELQNEVKNNTLYVKDIETMVINHFNGFNFGLQIAETKEEYVKIYIPADSSFEQANVTTDTGNVTFLSSLEAEQSKFKTEYGKVYFSQLIGNISEMKMDSCDLTIEQGKVDQLLVENEYGSIKIEKMESIDLDLKLDTGSIQLDDVTGGQLSVITEYGEVRLQNVEIKAAESGSGQVSVTSDSSYLNFKNVTSDTLILKSEYKDFTGENIKFRQADIKLESVNCTLNKVAADDLKMENEYGNINIGLQAEEKEYSYYLQTEYGKISLNGDNMGERYERGNEQKKSLKVKNESGNIDVSTE